MRLVNYSRILFGGASICRTYRFVSLILISLRQFGLGFIFRAPPLVPRLLINREKVGQRTGIMAMMGVSGGLEFDRKGNTRDVAWLGDCDEGCSLLAELLGWGVI